MLTRKAKKIKTYCALFFVLLGVYNMAKSGLSHAIGTADYVFLAFSLLLLLTNNRGLLLVFGLFGILVSFCVGIGGIVSHPEFSMQTSNLLYFLGYLLVFSSLGASFGLAYAALQTDDRNAFSLV